MKEIIQCYFSLRRCSRKRGIVRIWHYRAVALLVSWDWGSVGGTASVYSAAADAVCLLLVLRTDVPWCCVCVHFLRRRYGLDTGIPTLSKVRYTASRQVPGTQARFGIRTRYRTPTFSIKPVRHLKCTSGTGTPLPTMHSPWHWQYHGSWRSMTTHGIAIAKRHDSAPSP